MIPLLLPSNQGKCLALNTERGLLNTVLYVILAEALKSVGVRVCAGNETRAS